MNQILDRLSQFYSILTSLYPSGIWDLPLGHPSPVIPFLVVLTGSLLVGRVSGLIGRPVRRVIQGS